LIRGGPARLRPEIVSYYDETWFDYRVLWMTLRNPAIHFGYWDGATRTHGQSLDNMDRVMADIAQVRPEDRVLDAGCGVGGGAFWLAQNRGARVHGITIVENQAARGRRFARARQVEARVSFTCQDFCHTAFADAVFDVVWARESVCHADDKRAFFAEANRLLRPGGRLVMADFARVSRPSSPEAERLLRAWLERWAVPDLATPDELMRSAASAGFEDIQVEDVTSAVEPSLRHLHRLVTALSPGAKFLHRLHLRSDVQHGNIKGSEAMWAARRGGLWVYVIVSAHKPRVNDPAQSG
jgi:cyclopropane fatty-acyl-phospholipid synthase-like methyltransferase